MVLAIKSLKVVVTITVGVTTSMATVEVMTTARLPLKAKAVAFGTEITSPIPQLISRNSQKSSQALMPLRSLTTC